MAIIKLRKGESEMKTKYIRDFRHNYLVIEKEDPGQNGYLIKMITENTIDGLIPCQERMINGESLLYYDITSRQSIQSILEAQPLQMRHLQKLFSGLRTISEVMEKYLLSPEDLLLLPEFVYMDMATGEYSFIYYPERMGEENTSLRDLNEFFMQHMDSENILLVEAVYQMTDLLNRQQFVLDELITWFQENYDEEQMEERIHEQNEAMTQSNWTPNMQTQNLYRNQGSQSREAPVQNAGWNRGMQGTAQEMPWDEREKNRGTQWRGNVHSRSRNEGIQEQHMAEPRMMQEKGQEQKAPRNSGIRETTMSYVRFPESEEKKSLWRRLVEWAFPNSKINKKEYTVDSYRYVRYQDVTEPEKTPQPDDSGHTVFIPWIENSDNKLYGIGKSNKYHIPLQKLPITVGKMAGAVDLVLNDQSVSRLHARISRDGNRFFITDLNSTNGTFRNGMRLEPNASEIIEPGDEIGIGKLKFIYR